MGLIHWLRKKLGTETAVFVQIPLEGVDGHLYVSPMPFGPYDTTNELMRRYREEGVEFAVPLVTDEEIARKAKRDIFAAYDKAGIRVIRFPIRDLMSPSVDAVRELVKTIGPYLRAGAKVVVHCNAGVGRTGTIVACLVADALGMDGPKAVAYVQSQMATQITVSQKRVVERVAGGRGQAAQESASQG